MLAYLKRQAALGSLTMLAIIWANLPKFKFLPVKHKTTLFCEILVEEEIVSLA